MNNYEGHPVMYETALSEGQGARHRSDDFLFTYLLEGSCRITLGTLNYSAEAGQGFLIAPRFDTELENTGRNLFRAIHIHLSERDIEDYLLHNTAPDDNDSDTPADDTRPLYLFEAHILLHCLGEGIETAVAQGFRANRALTFLKIQECIQILTFLRPALHRWFSAMGRGRKIDLGIFMEENYMHNIPLDRFARASGRSLSSFRRDFVQRFGMQPGKWLLMRRLDEAYRRIVAGARPSELLMELGFESFSHFSRTFRERFGMLPSQVRTGNVD